MVHFIKKEGEMKMKKRFISLLLSLAMLLALLPTTAFATSGSGTRFRDVKTTDWFYEAVEYVAQNNMMSGTAANIFSPNQTTTRGMIVTILHRMEGEPTTTGTTFSDVAKGQWYTNAVAWASANDIVTGYGGGIFGPNDAITREQMAAILYRYAQHKGYETGASGNITSFSDGGKVSSYAVQAMKWAVGSGLISGVSNNTLSPQGGATRAQAATILMRFCNNVLPGTESKPTSPSNPSKKSEAEKYFESHSELKDIIDVEKSDGVLTEAQAKSVLEDLGFGQKRDGTGNLVGYPVTYAYSIKGDYTDETEVSAGSANRHPTYQTFYVSENREGWVIDVINGEIFANPVSFNLESDTNVMFLVSTTETLTSYDDATNKFYVTIPNDSEIFVKTVDSIDAETLDRLTVKEICRLTGATMLASADENVDNNEPVAAFSFNNRHSSYMASASARATNDDSITIVSLGDSYSAGEGIEPFIDQNLSWPEKARSYDFLAHRSENAWPKKLKEKLEKSTGKNVELHFAAVSGAKTEHFSSPQPKDVCKKEDHAVFGTYFISGMEMPKQLGIFDSIKGEDVDYVTLTIGGNDVDFAGIVALAATNCAYLYFGFTSALEDKLDEIWRNIDATMEDIEDVYEEIEGKAPNAAIIVAGYPRLFNVWGSGKPVTLVNELEAAMINEKVTAFNEKIKKLVGDCQTSGMNIHFVDVETAFDGHGVYSKEAWLNPIWLVPKSEDLDDLTIASAYSVHPNATGAEAYANCVYDKIQNIEANKKDTMKNKNALKGEVVVDMYTGMPQLRYYNDKGQVAYIIMMNSDWDPGSWDGMGTGYLHDMLAVAFTYDAQGKLAHSTSTDISLDRITWSVFNINRDLFEGELRYQYDGSEIKAYDGNEHRFSMDKNWNITKLNKNYGDRLYTDTAQYTYDNQGKVTAITHSDSDGSSYQVKVSYDSAGNVVAYDETDRYTDLYEEYDALYHEENLVMFDFHRKYYALAGNLKYSYENGRMIRFDDSGYSKWPWLFFYDQNGQVSGLQIEDLDDGTHGWHYVATRVDSAWPEFRSMFSLMDYRFSVKNVNGKPNITVKLSYNSPYDGSRYETVTIPSK